LKLSPAPQVLLNLPSLSITYTVFSGTIIANNQMSMPIRKSIVYKPIEEESEKDAKIMFGISLFTS